MLSTRSETFIFPSPTVRKADGEIPKCIFLHTDPGKEIQSLTDSVNSS